MQLTSFKKMYNSTINYLKAPKSLRLLRSLAALSLVGLATQASAVDLLAGTETILMETLQGTGKKYLYIAECVVSLLVYIQTKNVMVLVGIIVVAVFFNIMLALAT
jgi:hypothetical protein